MIADASAVSLDLPASLAKVKLDLLKLYGSRLSRLILFGSCARNEASFPDSDIDLAVVLVDPSPNVWSEISLTADLCSRFNLDFGILLNPFFCSESNFVSSSSPIYKNILSEGFLL